MTMKKLVLSLSIISLFTLCQNKKQYFLSSPEIDIAKKMMDAYQSKDWEMMRNTFADSASVLINGWWGDEISSEAYISALEEFNTTQLESYSLSDDTFYEMIINDEGVKWVHAWSQWSGKFANGNEAQTVINFGWLFEGDKVILLTMMYDSNPILQAQKNQGEENTQME